MQMTKQRIIRLGGAVDDDSCNLIVAQLLWLDATDPKKVSLVEASGKWQRVASPLPVGLGLSEKHDSAT